MVLIFLALARCPDRVPDDPDDGHGVRVALSLAVLGDQTTMSLALAWSYVGVRVIHSLVQVLRNHIQTRFALFVLSSLVLFGLTFRAAECAGGGKIDKI